ncbi:MAG: hypothetical protein J0L93_02005 [Deltaproteobacteria bacterium]|nr:hypothetical protein [Deltaproteobacteria bacterium]
MSVRFIVFFLLLTPAQIFAQSTSENLANYSHDVQLLEEASDVFKTSGLFDTSESAVNLDWALKKLKALSERAKAQRPSKLFAEMIQANAKPLAEIAKSPLDLQTSIFLHSAKAGVDATEGQIILDKLLTARLDFVHEKYKHDGKWAPLSSALWNHLLAVELPDRYMALDLSERLQEGDFADWIREDRKLRQPWNQGQVESSQKKRYALKAGILDAALSAYISRLSKTDLENYSLYNAGKKNSSLTQLLGIAAESGHLVSSLNIEARFGGVKEAFPENLQNAFDQAMNLAKTTEEFLEITKASQNYLVSPNTFHNALVIYRGTFLKTNPTYDQIKEFVIPFNNSKKAFPNAHPTGDKEIRAVDLLEKRIALTAEADPIVKEMAKELMLYNLIENLKEQDIQLIDRITRPVKSGADFMAQLNAIVAFQDEARAKSTEFAQQRNYHLSSKTIQNMAMKFVLAYLNKIPELDLTDQEFQSMIKMAERDVHRESSYLRAWNKAGREYLIRERVSREFAKNPRVTEVDHNLGALGYGAANSLISYNTIALDQLFRLRAIAQAKAAKANPRKDIFSYTDFSFLKPFVDSTLAAAKGKETVQEPRLFIPELTPKGPQADVAAHVLEALSRPAKNWDEKIQNYEAAAKIISERVPGQLNSGLVARVIAADIDRLPKSELTVDQGVKLLNILGAFVKDIGDIKKMVTEGDRIQSPASQYDLERIQKLYGEIYRITLTRAVPETYWTLPIIEKVATPENLQAAATGAIFKVAQDRGLHFGGVDYERLKMAAPFIVENSRENILKANIALLRQSDPERAEALSIILNGVSKGVSDQFAYVEELVNLAANIRKKSAKEIISELTRAVQLMRELNAPWKDPYRDRLSPDRTLYVSYVQEFMRTKYTTDQALEVMQLGFKIGPHQSSRPSPFLEVVLELYNQTLDWATSAKEINKLISFSEHFVQGKRFSAQVVRGNFKAEGQRFAEIISTHLDKIVHVPNQTPDGLISLAKSLASLRILPQAHSDLFSFAGDFYDSKAQALIEFHESLPGEEKYEVLPNNIGHISIYPSLLVSTGISLRAAIREILISLTKDGLRVDGLDSNDLQKLKNILGDRISIEVKAGIEGMKATYNPTRIEKIRDGVERFSLNCARTVRVLFSR